MLASEYGISVSFDIPITFRGYSSANRLENPSFETAGGGGSDVFAYWTEDTNSDSVTITRSSEFSLSGSYACKMASELLAIQPAPPLGFEGNVSQNVNVVPGSSYFLEFWSKVSGDGIWESQGRYGVYDVTNSEWILTPRNCGAFSAQNWTRVTAIFNVSLSTSVIAIYLYQGGTASTDPTGENWVYFDDVSVLQRSPLTRAPAPEWGGSGRLGSYRQTISVNVGFDNMQLTTAGTESYIGDWFEHGLARRALVTSPEGVLWEGFVNQISANLGGAVLTLGPLIDVVNRGRIIYKEMNWDTTPPIGGDTVRGEWVNSEDSQSKYGILEGMITGAEGTTDEMSQLIHTIVTTAAWPEIAQNISIGSGSNIDLTISCLGYGHLLNKQFFTETSTADLVTVTEKIAKILDNDPNNIFTSGNSLLAENATETTLYENSDRTSLAILKEIAAMGDEEYNRYVFGVFEDRKFSYWNATNLEPKYFWSMRTNRVQLVNTANVEPYEVRPGQWVRITDLMATKPAFDVDTRTDPRFMFLESVTYSAPYTLSMTGGRANTFRQKLDRLGIGGI